MKLTQAKKEFLKKNEENGLNGEEIAELIKYYLDETEIEFYYCGVAVNFFERAKYRYKFIFSNFSIYLNFDVRKKTTPDEVKKALCDAFWNHFRKLKSLNDANSDFVEQGLKLLVNIKKDAKK
ncbi:hypothetical protein [Ligilactobacillus equi]|uniref:hypothetical protein n=1 Tax=Ligilactobacillus equi TaxID=137357 RepID=UPI00046A04BE|nr:hypothetical protein [Ligilactobacillus equi]